MNHYNSRLDSLNQMNILDIFDEMEFTQQEDCFEYIQNHTDNPHSKKWLVSLLNHSEYWVKCEAIDILKMYPPDSEIDQIFIKMIDDPDELVKTDAIEMIGERQIKSESTKLKKFLQNKSFLVRGTTALSLAKLGDRKAESAIRSRLKTERNHWVKLNFLFALYRFGDRQKLFKIIRYLTDKSYRVRCAAVNVLAEIAEIENEVNHNKIVKALQERFETEEIIAVKSTITSALEDITL